MNAPIRTLAPMPAGWPAVACCMGDGSECVCPKEEAALRAWKAGRVPAQMDAPQRAWCLNEISKVEGYSTDDYSHVPDDELAGAVLDAWTDYARDKGLL